MPSSRPGKYRKRPVTIYAMQLTRENQHDVIRWGHENQTAFTPWWSQEPTDQGYGKAESGEWGQKGLHIPTLEGLMRAEWGCYIIQGVKGEFYPCAEAIFTATYDEVESPENYLGTTAYEPVEPVERVTVPDWDKGHAPGEGQNSSLNALTGVPQPQTHPGLFEAPHPCCRAPHSHLEMPANRITHTSEES